ncbi:MAG: MCE family protein [Winogradskyella sp.]|uniref:MlaD family protein n=1 Tax=Winogradskyella sp. TaxID=1883156 RepID=UPI00183ABCD7|nr:MlaD family protein [Winogradskyella sp.]MBT8244449.1 MCE family protein [Winogradskyella sp.]NNK22401.1 MCE family protein [Winogradskyella sp.]
MKTTEAQKIRLGIFVIIGTLLFVTAVYFIGQRQNMFEKTFTISAYFQNVNGLQKGNNVRYSGIDIGTVKDISMINDSTIKVDMAIEEKILSHIKIDAIAAVGSDGLVGNMIINIVPGKNGNTPVIEDGDIIESYSKIGTDDILSTLGSSSENIAILSSDLLKITNAMIEGKGTLGVLLNDTLMAKDLKQSIKNFKMASYGASKSINELNTLLTAIKTNDETVLGLLINDTISGQKLKTVVANLEASSLEIGNLVKNANTVVTDIQSNEGALNYVLNDTSLVNSLKSTLKNINEGTDKFNQNMEALKHNFLTRSYFRKLERQAEKAKRNDN